MQAAAQHLPLDRDRHAELVAQLSLHNLKAYRVLFLPIDYIFDRCDVCPTKAGKYPHDNCGLTLMLEMEELRYAFLRCTEWGRAMKIIGSLIEKDREACGMSIGVRFGDRVIKGQAMSC